MLGTTLPTYQIDGIIYFNMHEHVKETFSYTCSLKVYINCYHHLCISWVTSTTATTKGASYVLLVQLLLLLLLLLLQQLIMNMMVL